ncbi:MAG: hypothetical protein LC650_01055 [Actinobacteria bacterium]|nr:hypothetical protein [Actinomycetota bacterium]
MIGPKIRRFVLEGAVADPGHLIRKQPTEEKRLRLQMFRDGHIPVLDIPPLVYTEYQQDKGTFLYSITMYGVEVEDAREAEGWLTGQVMKPTLQTKLERLSNPSELMS